MYIDEIDRRRVGESVVVLGILNVIMILCYLLHMTNIMLLLGGVIWSCFSYIYEKKIWVYFFSEYLQDRIASGLVVVMAMVTIYFCLYANVGVSCIVCSTLECLCYQMWKTYHNRTSNNYKGLLVFAILLFLEILIIV